MILVTGASGFVGSRVVHELRAARRDVRYLVRERRQARRLESWGCKPVEGDVTRRSGRWSAPPPSRASSTSCCARASSSAGTAAANATFELGGQDAVTWDELYERIRRTLGVRRLTVHVPFALADLNARVLERLPGPPLTRDQVKMLAAVDSTCDMTPALEVFGLGALPLAEQIRRAA